MTVRRVLAWLGEPVRIFRATRRDPFYRYELRQWGWWRTPAAVGVAVLLVVPAAYCCLFGIGLYAVPAVLTAEGLLAESDRGTLEGMLVTPLSRIRWLWAKLLARLRAVFWLAAACPALGLAVGAVVAMLDVDSKVNWLVPPGIGLGAGTLVGVLMAGQCLSSGAAGLVAVLLGRTRMGSFLYSYLLTAPFYVLDSMVLGLAYLGWLVAFLVPGVPVSGDQLIPPQYLPWLYAALAAGTLLVLALRAVLYVWVLPPWMLRWAAQNLDQKLLGGG